MASDEGRLAGKVALITGAASGMGRAVAERFAAEGAAVVAVDIEEGGVKATVEAIVAAGGTAQLVVADVADAAQVAAAVETARREHQGLDVAVTAAAIEREAVPLHECDDDNYDRIMAVNVRGVFLAMKHEMSSWPTSWSGCWATTTRPSARCGPASARPACSSPCASGARTPASGSSTRPRWRCSSWAGA